MEYPKELHEAALARARESKAERADTIQSLLQQQDPVEPAGDRLTSFMARRAGLTTSQVEKFVTLQQINNMVPICFAEDARRAANAVARFVTPAGRGRGTCFLISPRLLLTAGHAVPSAEVAKTLLVEFNFEVDSNGESREVSQYRLAPERFFVTDPVLSLDYTVVALGEKVSGPEPDLTFCPISNRDDKHALGFCANVIQHPADLDKQLAVRENRLVYRTDNLLTYMTETRGGSSGSPVFNDEWEVVAVHHWGGTTGFIKLPSGITLPDNVNEGVRASAIVNSLISRRETLAPEWQELLDEAIPPAAAGEPSSLVAADRFTNGAGTNRLRPLSIR
jgi:endonuclease G